MQSSGSGDTARRKTGQRIRTRCKRLSGTEFGGAEDYFEANRLQVEMALAGRCVIEGNTKFRDSQSSRTYRLKHAMPSEIRRNLTKTIVRGVLCMISNRRVQAARQVTGHGPSNVS